MVLALQEKKMSKREKASMEREEEMGFVMSGGIWFKEEIKEGVMR